MNVKKLLLVVGVVLLGVALFFAGTSFAQSDGGDGEGWHGMMGGQGWHLGSMHGWDDDAERGPYGDVMGDEAYHDAMHEAHGDVMGDEAYHDAMHEAHGDMMDDEAYHDAMHEAHGDMMDGWPRPNPRGLED